MEETNKYICSGNGKPYEGKPWITIKCDRWDEINGPVKFSSYLEYKYNLDKLPKTHFHLIHNIEDFSEPRPVLHQPYQELFQFLTETEINSLTDEEYCNYKDNLEYYFMMNPIRSQIYEESMNNDNYSRSIEDSYSSDDDSYLSDDSWW